MRTDRGPTLTNGASSAGAKGLALPGYLPSVRDAARVALARRRLHDILIIRQADKWRALVRAGGFGA